MPIEIKEIVVRASIDNSAGPLVSKPAVARTVQKLVDAQKEKIIAECTAEVMTRLERNNER